ncbi:MAG: hypothetical protein ACK48V_01355 [Crocinitomicaceae bacterium]|jgi:hypothetical protein
MKVDKLQLQKTMLNMYETIINDLKEELKVKETLANIDEDNTLDPEDYSNQTVSKEMKMLLQKQLDKAQFDFEKVKNMDFSEKSEAVVGALVTTDMFNFILGVATTPFLFGNMQIVGVSTEAPIFSSLLGRKEGDSFQFTGHQYNINYVQ